MAKNLQQIESELQRSQQALRSRLREEEAMRKAAGGLPGAIQNIWNQTGGKDTQNLRNQAGKIRGDYITATADARSKYRDIYDPFKRDQLAARSAQQAYRPLADINSELEARYQALGLGTQAAQSMYAADIDAYQAGTQRHQIELQQQESNYSRALERAREAQRQRERQQDIARSRAAAAAKASQPKALTVSDKKRLAQQNIDSYIRSGDWLTEFDSERSFLPQLYEAFGDVYSQQELRDMFYDARAPFENDRGGWGKGGAAGKVR